jgi:hypothetical protein
MEPFPEKGYPLKVFISTLPEIKFLCMGLRAAETSAKI